MRERNTCRHRTSSEPVFRREVPRLRESEGARSSAVSDATATAIKVVEADLLSEYEGRYHGRQVDGRGVDGRKRAHGWVKNGM